MRTPYTKHKGKKYKRCKLCSNYKKKEQFYVAYIKNNRNTYATICKSCDKKRTVNWLKNHRELQYIYNAKMKYNLNKEDYLNLKKKQSNKCAVCFKRKYGNRLDIDHCHKTKKVRGLLCNNCNRGIGHLMENISILKNAIRYIKKHE